jgi:hypothetical protein
MASDETLAATAVHAWKMNLERAEKFFLGLSEDQLQKEVAPGKNRLIYLFGHLIAVHDYMLPVLGLGERRHPELEDAFLTKPDRAVGELPTRAELHQCWRDVHDTLRDQFARLTPAEWLMKHTLISDEDFAATPLRNRLAVLLSRVAHINSHLGQAALAPK